MIVNLFRVLGILTLFLVLGVVLVAVLGLHGTKLTTADWVRLSIFTILGFTLGIGMLYLRKWAALVLSCLCLALAIWIIAASIKGPFPDTIVVFAFGIPFTFVPILTVGYWSRLR